MCNHVAGEYKKYRDSHVAIASEPLINNTFRKGVVRNVIEKNGERS